MYLFFDTETTGLPKRWNAPVTDLENWPRLVQLAWIMYDDRGNMLESRDVIVKPEGFTIPPEASRVHGITTLVAREKGEPLQEVMEQFARKIDEATALVGHNISFDECIVGAEFERLRMMTTLFLKPKYCTMKLSTDYRELITFSLIVIVATTDDLGIDVKAFGNGDDVICNLFIHVDFHTVTHVEYLVHFVPRGSRLFLN